MDQGFSLLFDKRSDVEMAGFRGRASGSDADAGGHSRAACADGTRIALETARSTDSQEG